MRLLDSGVNADEWSRDGLVPLCVAAFWGHEQVVLLLLERGANVNLANKGTLWTAMHCAAFQGERKERTLFPQSIFLHHATLLTRTMICTRTRQSGDGADGCVARSDAQGC